MAEPQTDPQAVADDSNASVGSAIPGADASRSAGIQDAKSPEIMAGDDDAPDSLMGEVLLFLKEEKKWWLAPLVVVLLLLSAVIIFAEGSAIAPFIYTIF